MNPLEKYTLPTYTTYGGAQYKDLSTSYQVFGKAIHSAPIVVIIHALTGNSDVAGKDKGWWKDIVGENKLIDTTKFSVISFNIPGNGVEGEVIDNYKDFTTKDIARIFYLTLAQLDITRVFAIIGGSLGGGITWELVSLYPKLAQYIIPIAADWKSSDWIIGHNSVQESILLHSNQPIIDARKMAMLLYRTPQSFTRKFNRSRMEDSSLFSVVSWLNHHGEKLNQRFQLKPYLFMNHLLSTIDAFSNDVPLEKALSKIESTIIQIGISSDLFFIPEENRKTHDLLNQLNQPNEYHEIKSEDGHDAFLIEHQQITNFLKNIFKN